jgi:Cu(I)/Ag(I) efflux system membrane fusion protein
MKDTITNSDAGAESQEAAQDTQQGTSTSVVECQESRRWWIKLVVQPVLLLAAGAALIVGLGLAQKAGWISAGGGSGDQTASSSGDTRTYICPMLCTPPQIGPGRCPVCEMELVPAASGGGSSDSQSVQIDPAARRVANIHTAAAKSIPLTRTIRAIGELNYDEGSLKTISAYVDGRLDRLYADFTGVVVEQGDHLALVYSPRLYSGQVELLLAKKARDGSQAVSLQRVVQSNRDMYESTRQRLIELGMTEEQIEQLELADEANSRMHLCAPISGTVIKKYATEGQYVKEGQAIYELADLSTVWLMLELFPEDAATIRYGQKVEAEVQSLPGRTFTGRVAFVDPTVDPVKRTVGVRVVIPNDDGILRVGDYARATVQIPLANGGTQGKIYDPELANKWISPRHPHVVESSAGKCRVCGIELVPSSQFGFTSEPNTNGEALVVPRSAVLMAGRDSVVYVETKPGRFEIRNVVLGGRSGDQIVVLDGLKDGEEVAVSGNFLIDSQMQLAGNPSLIDPTKAQPSVEIEFDKDDLPPIVAAQMVVEGVVEPPQTGSQSPIEQIDDRVSVKQAAELDKLSANDRILAERQKVCPVTDIPLGSMGAPIKVMVEDRPVFICCEGCRKRLLAESAKYLAKFKEEAVR